MGRRLGIYTLGHFMSLRNAPTKKIWNPLLKNSEHWELSQLDTSLGEDRAALEQTLEGMQLTYGQILHGFFPLAERVECLERIKVEFTKSFDNLAIMLSLEVQKPIKFARGECERSVATLDAAIKWGHELLANPPTREAPGHSGFAGRSEALPRGIALGVTPFNFPHNLSLHKIAPALLAGCPLIWRPSWKCQLSNLALVDVLHAAKVPAGLIAFLPMTHDTFWELVHDPRISCLSFTGSEVVGWSIQEKFRGPTVLELGGAAPVYIEKLAGDSLAAALHAIASSAFGFAGQSCISAQNLLVHEDLYDEVKTSMEQITEEFPCGPPEDESTLCSAVIDADAAARISEALANAEKSESKIFRSSKKLDIPNFVAPTLVTEPTEKLRQNEIFAPVLNLIKVKNNAEFIKFANGLPHRLQAAVYSSDLETLASARLDLDFGGVALGQPPSVRVDSLPYGGRGLAGIGAEDPQSSWSFYSAMKTIYTKT